MADGTIAFLREKIDKMTVNRGRQVLNYASMALAGAAEWEDRFGREARKGADILVQSLEREGVQRIFAYPGGCSMEIHQALTRSPSIKNILCRHEQVRGLRARYLYIMVGTWGFDGIACAWYGILLTISGLQHKLSQ